MSRPLALIALVTAAFDLVVLVVLHLAQPGVDVVREPTSAYVHGSLGWLSPLASAAVGIGGLCLAAAIWRIVPGVSARVGVAMVGLFGVAKLAQAFFPIDPPGATTASGTVHDLLGNLAFFTLPVAAVLVTSAVARANGRGPGASVGWLLVAFTVLVLTGDALGWFGLAQRAYLVAAAGWTALVSVWLLRPARRLALG